MPTSGRIPIDHITLKLHVLVMLLLYRKAPVVSCNLKPKQTISLFGRLILEVKQFSQQNVSAL